ncbi:hypothetical protein ACWFMI_16785 [Nocardiopsis terrae]
MATLPAVVFALGPAQVLRLVRIAGTLRLVRVSRIVEAGGALHRRTGPNATDGEGTDLPERSGGEGAGADQSSP